ncbi:MAG: hypothetical protein ACREA7_06985 [Nitrosotalea sp.]
MFKRILDSGRVLGGTITINNDTNPMNPYVSAKDNNIFVAWTDASPGIYHVFFRASHDNGTTFEPTVYLEGSAPIIQSHDDSLGSIGIVVGLIFMAGVSAVGVIVGILYVMRKKQTTPLHESQE